MQREAANRRAVGIEEAQRQRRLVRCSPAGRLKKTAAPYAGLSPNSGIEKFGAAVGIATARRFRREELQARNRLRFARAPAARSSARLSRIQNARPCVAATSSPSRASIARSRTCTPGRFSVNGCHVRAAVEADVGRAARAGKEQARLARILTHDEDVLVGRQSAGHRRPMRAVVGRLVDVRMVVVPHVARRREIGGALVRYARARSS